MRADAVSEERDHILNATVERLQHLERISHQVQLAFRNPMSIEDSAGGIEAIRERPQYVFVSREVEGGKNFYTKIGSAWNVAKEGISITLDATPVDGRMVRFPVKKED